jgi:hypothetical protein
MDFFSLDLKGKEEGTIEAYLVNIWIYRHAAYRLTDL